MLYQLSHFRPRSTASKGGAEGQDRTGDTAIFSRVLYRLSYLGPMGSPRWAAPSALGRIPRASRAVPRLGGRRVGQAAHWLGASAAVRKWNMTMFQPANERCGLARKRALVRRLERRDVPNGR